MDNTEIIRIRVLANEFKERAIALTPMYDDEEYLTGTDEYLVLRDVEHQLQQNLGSKLGEPWAIELMPKIRAALETYEENRYG